MVVFTVARLNLKEFQRGRETAQTRVFVLVALSSAEAQRFFFSGGEDPLSNVSAGTVFFAPANTSHSGFI